MGEPVTNNEYKLGAVEARIDTMDQKLERVEDKVDRIQQEVHRLTLKLAEVEGAWKFAVKAAAFISGAFSFGAGILVKVFFDK